MKVREETRVGEVVRIDTDLKPFVYLRWDDGSVGGWYENQANYEVIIEAPESNAD